MFYQFKVDGSRRVTTCECQYRCHNFVYIILYAYENTANTIELREFYLILLRKTSERTVLQVYKCGKIRDLKCEVRDKKNWHEAALELPLQRAKDCSRIADYRLPITDKSG